MKKLKETEIVVILLAPMVIVYILFAICYGYAPILWGEVAKPVFIAMEIFIVIFALKAVSDIDRSL